MDPRNRTDGVASTRQEYEDWAAAMVMPRSDRILDCWALSAWEEATKRVEARNISKRLLLDLLAIIHCDGGHHTGAVGLEQSVEDAKKVICGLKTGSIEAEHAAGRRHEVVAYIVHVRFPGGYRIFATLPGYSLAPNETLVYETPLGVIK